MRSICSYCRAQIGEIEPQDDPRVSHGMCQPCMEHFEKAWTAKDLSEYLETFSVPVVAVDPEGRVIAANGPAGELTGKGRERTTGFLGGEFMECEFSRLPEGCGRTVHCAACAVRNTVERARATGVAQERVPAWIDQEGGRLNLLISTHPEDGFVRLEIHEVRTASATG